MNLEQVRIESRNGSELEQPAWLEALRNPLATNDWTSEDIYFHHMRLT